MGKKELKQALAEIGENSKITLLIKKTKVELFSLPFNYGFMVDVVIYKDDQIREFSNIKNLGISKYKTISNHQLINKIFREI